MPTESEITILRQYCKIVDEIHECRFIRGINEQDHSITVDIDPRKNRMPHYDKDDFRSFATLFRKLVAQGEPTQLFRVMNILKRYAPADKKYTFDSMKKGLLAEAENPPLALAIGRQGEEKGYTPKQICEILFNADIFHSDPTKQDDLARLFDFHPFVMAAFLRYATIVVNAATAYAANIRYFKYLQEITSEADAESTTS